MYSNTTLWCCDSVKIDKYDAFLLYIHWSGDSPQKVNDLDFLCITRVYCEGQISFIIICDYALK